MLATLSTIKDILENGGSWESQQSDYCNGMLLLKRYLKLIEDFPEFQGAEMDKKFLPYFKEGNGYSPTEYVKYAFKKLRCRDW